MTASETPLPEELAKTIITEMLPPLRDLYKRMVGIQVEWLTDDLQEPLATAAANNTLLAGHSAATWEGWGKLLLKLQVWLETPDADLGGKTPKDLLFKKYVAQ